MGVLPDRTSTFNSEYWKGLLVNGFKIAVQTYCLAEPIKKALHIAGQLACDGVQIDARHQLRPAELSETGLRQLRKMLDDLNLRVGSLAFPTRRGFANPEDLQRRIEATQSVMQLASRLKARVLVCQLGRIPPEAEEQARTTLQESLGVLSATGNRLGVQLAAQTQQTSTDELVGFLATLPEGSLGLDLHPERLMAERIAPAEFVRVAGGHVVHVHAVDSVYDVGAGRNVEVALGRGTADFPQLVGLLEEYNYRGWLTIERRQGPNVIEDASNAVQYLRTL